MVLGFLIFLFGRRSLALVGGDRCHVSTVTQGARYKKEVAGIEKAKKLVGWICLALLAVFLVIALLPLPFCLPLADDFGYGAPVHFAVLAGEGPLGVLSAVWDNLCYTYQNWQGTFTSILLFSVTPGAFSDRLYAVTPAVMLALAVSPVFLALGCVQGLERWGRQVIGALAALLAVAYLPSPGQGLYWWNSGAHYLASWFLAVLTFTLQLRLSRRDKFSPLWPVCWLTAFLAGGGNYSTALVYPLLAAALTVYYAAYKKRGRRVAVPNAVAALFGGAGLIVSVLAPGNAVRQGLSETLSPVDAVLLSFRHGGLDLARRLCSWPVLAALMVAAAVFLLAARESKYTYPMPLLVIFGGFCAYCALYTPVLYAMGGEWVPPRMENLLWLAGLFFLFGSVLYLAGWAASRLKVWARPKASRAPAAATLAGGLVFLLALGLTFEQTASAAVLEDLQTGVLADYRDARAERQAVWQDAAAGPVRFRPKNELPAPGSFMPTAVLTWGPDVIVDGVAVEVPCRRACGCEVTYLPISWAEEFFGAAEPWPEDGFSAIYPIAGQPCAPIRELVERGGGQLTYDGPTDTIYISRNTTR